MNDSSLMIETPDIDSSSDDYAGRFQGEVGKWFLEVQMNATLKCLHDISNAEVLDVGGGHGQTISGLLNAGHSVTVFGSSPDCSKRIQTWLDSGKVKFETGNLVKLPYKDQSYDLVISYRMLTHLKQWKLFIKELTRVSKKCVIIDFPTYKSVNFFADLLFALKKKIEKNTRNYQLFHESDEFLFLIFCDVSHG